MVTTIVLVGFSDICGGGGGGGTALFFLHIASSIILLCVCTSSVLVKSHYTLGLEVESRCLDMLK